MRQNLEKLLGIPGNCIGLKAGTMEQMGFVGREEGIAVQAVTLLQRGSEEVGTSQRVG
jgi:2-C-methyl-D-erythritol 2,4-cyclodiphosphate synthase